MAAALDFFVVGCERSGTTLPRAILQAHPQLAVPPESYFAFELLRHRRWFEGRAGVLVNAVSW